MQNLVMKKVLRFLAQKVSQLKEENGQGWFAWSLGKVKSAMTEVVVIDADVTKPYFAKVTKALAT